MEQRIEVLCDRCGKEIKSYDIKISSAKIQLWEECYVDFIKFLEGRTE